MSLYQRGNVWYYLFYLNGKRYRGSTKTENEKEAGRIYAKAMVAAEAGESTKPKRAPLVQDFVKEFLDWLDKTMLKQQTKNDYKNGCRLILRSSLCGMRLDQITKDDIETTKFHESEASRDCGLRTTRRMLSKARDWKLIREVPRVKRPKLAGRDRMVTDADEELLLPACPRPRLLSQAGAVVGQFEFAQPKSVVLLDTLKELQRSSSSDNSQVEANPADLTCALPLATYVREQPERAASKLASAEKQGSWWGKQSAVKAVI
jgi:hypothetical protein